MGTGKRDGKQSCQGDCMGTQLLQSCPILCLWTLALQVSLSMGFSRQEYLSGLPYLPPGDLPDSGIKPASRMSPALAGGFFTIRATWEAPSCMTMSKLFTLQASVLPSQKHRQKWYLSHRLLGRFHGMMVVIHWNRDSSTQVGLLPRLEQLLELTSPAQHGPASVLSSTPDLSPSPQSLAGQVFF